LHHSVDAHTRNATRCRRICCQASAADTLTHYSHRHPVCLGTIAAELASVHRLG
jgi:hypothetical protein